MAMSPTLFAKGANGVVRRARRPIANQYIVTLAGVDDPEAVGLETQTLFAGRLKHVYRHAIHGFTIRLTPAQAARLAADPRVKDVEEDAIVEATDIQSSPPWGLDRIDQRMRPLDLQYQYALADTPVYVHVIDTGIRASHTEFGGRAFVAGDYITPSTDGEDCNGHGTHVAARIGGSTYGVAK